MAQPTVVGNGCSLEDCYTNLFTLIDLAGIRYRKYSYGSQRNSALCVEDSILASFSRCRHHGYLCAWTRKPRESTDPNKPYDVNNFTKELWLFWYDETEPSKIHEMISPDLKEIDTGSWENGLSYECRTVLFKALHNVIENCLISQGYLRVGRWFTQPMKKNANQSANERNYSVSFSFFLHGESTVCASLDVRQLKPLRKISQRHLKLCVDNNIKLRVILSPYGISGHLTGRRYREDDQPNVNLLHQWKLFYPLNFDEDLRGGANDLNNSGDLAGRAEPCLPKLVEVMVSGRRMRYPSCFVLVADDDISQQLREKLEDSPSISTSYTGISPMCSAALGSISSIVSNSQSTFGQSSLIPQSQQTQPQTQTSQHQQSQSSQNQSQAHQIQVNFSGNTRSAVLMAPRVSTLLPYYGQRGLTRAHQDAFIPLKRKNNSNPHGSTNSANTGNNVSALGELFSSSVSSHTQSPLSKGSWQYCDRSEWVDCECRRVFDSARQLPLMQRQGAARNSRFYNRFRTRPIQNPTQSNVPSVSNPPTNAVPTRITTCPDAAWEEVNLSFDRTLRVSAPQRPATGSGEPIMPTLSPQTPILEKENGPDSLNQNSSASVANDKFPSNSCQEINTNSLNTGSEAMDTEPPDGIKTPASAPGPIGIAIDSSPFQPNQHATHQCTNLSEEGKVIIPNSDSEWPSNHDGLTTNSCQASNGAMVDCYDSSMSQTRIETKSIIGAIHLSSNSQHLPSTSEFGLPVGQNHSWDVWNERMTRNWTSQTNHNAIVNNVEVTSPSRPTLTPGVEEVVDPLHPSRDAGHIRIAGLRRPRIAGCWLEEPESKYLRMGFALPSPLLTNKHRSQTEFSGSGSSSHCKLTATGSVTSVSQTTQNGQSTEVNDLRILTRPEKLELGPNNWKNEAALRPTDKVPDQIFDCDEDDGDPSAPLLHKQQPTDVGGQMTNSSQSQQIGHSIASSNGSGPIAAAELARMYPTPPSTEVNHALASPVEPAVASGAGAIIPHPEVQPSKSCTLGSSGFGGIPSSNGISVTPQKGNPSTQRKSKPLDVAGALVQPEMDWTFGRPVQGMFVFGVPYSMSLGLESLESIKEEIDSGLSYHHQKAGAHPLLQKTDRIPNANQMHSTSALGGPLATGTPLAIGASADVPQSPASLPTLPGSNAGPGHGGRNTPLLNGRYFPGSAPPGSHRVNPLTPSSSCYQGTHPGGECASLTSAGASPATAAPTSAMRTPRTPGTGGFADYSSPASSGTSSTFVGSRTGGLGSVGGNQHSVERPASHPPPPAASPIISEVHSLLINLVLSDTMLNLFKDHNFESCNICECNFNTKGDDVGLYLLDSPLCQSENKRPCTCGFSAVVNKRLAPHSGLFYEDEAELVGVREERPFRVQPPLLRLNENGSPNHLEKLTPIVQRILYDQVMSSMDVFTTGYLLDWYRHERTRQSFTIRENAHEFKDACEVVRLALDASVLDKHINGSSAAPKLDDDSRLMEPLHSWPFLKEAQRLPQEEGEALSLLKSIRPCLHQALCPTRTLECTYNVSGPLTWKEFHKLAGRGNEESCEPQPLPQILVGSEVSDGIAISPYAIQHWEQLSLKPFSRPKDVWYLVVAPDNSAIVSEVSHFFRELSCVYELCRLGRHIPLPDVVSPDDHGIVRVSERLSLFDSEHVSPSTSDFDQWFAQLAPHHIASHADVTSKVALYASVCRHYIVNNLKTHGPRLLRQAQNAAVAAASTTSSISASNKQTSNGSPTSFSSPSSCGGGNGNSSSGSSGNGSYSMPPLRSLKSNAKGDANSLNSDSATAANAFHLVIYLVNPFVYSHDYGDIYRLAMLAMVKMVSEIKSQLPIELQHCTLFQIVPLSQITGLNRAAEWHAANQNAAIANMQSWHRPKPDQVLTLKSMAFDTYTQLRRIPTVQQFNGNRTLTGFGPTAELEEQLRRQPELLRSERLLYSPAFTLLPNRDYRSLRDRKASDNMDKSSVLFCAYCLSEDQQWLMAVCIDATGELLEHTCINIRIPERHRRKRASARRIGLQKLWDFIICIISGSSGPWRLVIQRIGRIGHGELTAWNGLLGKKNLARTTALLRENCHLCAKLHAGAGGSNGGMNFSPAQQDLPSLVSACFVSMEPQSTFRVWPQLVCTTEERMSSNLPLVTPRDTSVTHILVFPTSAMAQCTSISGGMGLGMGIMGGVDGNIFEGLDIEDGIDGIDFDFADQEILVAVVGGPNSPTSIHPLMGGVGGPVDMNPKDGASASGGPTGPVDPQDDVTNTLMQQPLAMGFYLSTAPAGPLPSWFWSTCPQASVLCPSIFKAALHVNTYSVTDDVGVQTGKERVAHPLDSSLTTDVLRFVLESYNSLSWLTIDPVTNDRRSCLPVHILYLTHLSNAQFAFI